MSRVARDATLRDCTTAGTAPDATGSWCVVSDVFRGHSNVAPNGPTHDGLLSVEEFATRTETQDVVARAELTGRPEDRPVLPSGGPRMG